MARTKFTRSELLELVWSAPLSKLATDLGIASYTLKSIAHKAGLPTPPQGHWQRIAHGKKSDPKPALPPRGFGAPDDIEIGSSYYERIKLEDPIPPAPTFDETLDDVRRRAVRAIVQIVVPRDLARAHPAIAHILRDEISRFEAMKTADYVFSWNKPRFTAPIDQRRLRLLNAICLGLARADIKTKLWRTEDAVIWIGKGALSFPITAQKLVAKGKDAETDQRLSIVAGVIPGQRDKVLAQWNDADDARLETRVSDIAVDIAVLLEQEYRDRKVSGHEWLIRRRAELIEEARKAKIEAERKERERLEQLERERIDRLIGDADQLRRAQAIRAYVTEATALHAAQTGIEDDAALDRWRAWALAQADRTDPVKNGRFIQAVDDLG